jgi:AcrR family transcriptional regulator
MPKGFTEDERAAIRRRLLAEGERLFARQGLRKTGVGELARAAQISTGAFYAFFPSKEALFMEVVEQAEQRHRQKVLIEAARPGPTPRARLTRVLRAAFAQLQRIPVLQRLTSSDYALLFRRMPPADLEAHLASDRAFFVELVTRCRAAGIPIQVEPEALSQIVYPLVLAAMHTDDLGAGRFTGGLDVLLELAAAYCLGEIEIERRAVRRPARKDAEDEPGN